MKINWFKIKSELVQNIIYYLFLDLYVKVDIILLLDYFNIIYNIITQGLICKDCEKRYNKCRCNYTDKYTEKEIFEILKKFINHNYSINLFDRLKYSIEKQHSLYPFGNLYL